MAMPVYPTIVVPGITATYLLDEYRLPPETIWSVMTKEYERASLHPDNLRYEAVEPARVITGQVFEVAYRELIDELRHNLRPREDASVPVFAFGYDWRQPLARSAAQLAAFIEEVAERTALMRHYANEDYGNSPKVNLIGHSMGGLVIAGYLARHGKEKRVHKVATLATPFQGSFEAIIKMITGTADLGTSPPSSREREAARLTPALYSLLPSFAAADNDYFDSKNWQSSVLKTIEEYIRLHGVSPRDKKAQAREVFEGLLSAARAERNLTDKLNLASAGMTADDWLCVVGVGTETRVALKAERSGGSVEFRLSSKDRRDRWADAEDPTAQKETGDGTVPFEGAVPRFLSEKNIVCVTPEDFGYWEIQDRATRRVAGFHGILPNMDLLHRMIASFLSGKPPRHDNVWGRSAPGVETPEWPGSLRGMRKEPRKSDS